MVSPRPIYLGLEGVTGHLLLEDDGALLLEESAAELWWHNLQGDNDWSRRDNYTRDQQGTVSAAGVYARYWRVVVDTQGGAATPQVGELYLDDSGENRVSPQNMTANALPTPFVASTSTGSATAWQAFDGDTATGVDIPAGQWLEIDLGNPRWIHRAAIRWNGVDSWASQWRVQASSDGLTFRDVRTVVSGSDVSNTRVDAPVAEPQTVRTTYRYWRLTSQSDPGGLPEVRGLRLLRDQQVVSPRNMVDNTTPGPYVASASSVDGTDEPYQAFDGDDQTTAWTPGVTTAGEWLQIDLGASQEVTGLWLSQGVLNPGWVLSGSDDGLAFQDVLEIPAGDPQITAGHWGGWVSDRPAEAYRVFQLSVDNLLGYWPFGVDSLLDVSGAGRDLTDVSGDIGLDVPGPSQTSGLSPVFGSGTSRFDIQDDGTIVGSTSGASLSLWIRRDFDATVGWSGRRCIWDEGDQDNGFNVYTDGQALYAGSWTNANGTAEQQFLTYPGLERGRWYHVHLTFDQGWTHLYVDGQRQASARFPTNTVVGSRLESGVLPCLGAVNTSTRYHDGPVSFGSGISGDFCGQGFELGEVARWASPSLPDDPHRLWTVANRRNALSRGDDLRFDGLGLGATDDATTQTQDLAVSRLVMSSTAVQMETQRYLTTRLSPNGDTQLNQSFDVAASSTVVVGPEVTARSDDSDTSNWMNGQIDLWGRFIGTRVGPNHVDGSGQVVVVGDQARLEKQGADELRIRVPVTDQGVDYTRLVFDSTAGQEVWLVGNSAGGSGSLSVYQAQVDAGAVLRFYRVDDSDVTIRDNLQVEGRLDWEGLNDQGTGVALVTIGATAVFQFGGHAPGTFRMYAGVEVAGGTVLFQEFGDSPTWEIHSDWAITSDSVFEVATTSTSIEAVAWVSPSTLAGPANLVIDLTTSNGSFVWTHLDSTPTVANCTILSDLGPYDQLPGAGYRLSAKPAGITVASWGTGTLTIDNAAFLQSHDNSGDANRLVVDNPVVVQDYACWNTQRVANAPVNWLTGQIDLRGILHSDAGDDGAAQEQVIAGDLVVDQATTAVRQVSHRAGAGIDLVLSGGITDGPGVATNTLVIEARGDGLGEDIYIRSLGVSAATLEFRDTPGTGERIFLDGMQSTSILQNRSADLVLLNGPVTAQSYSQTQVSGAAATLDLNGQELVLTGGFNITQGLLADPAGSTVNSATWTMKDVDAVGTASWSVVTTAVRPLFSGSATLAYSDATGSVSQGLIDTLSGATDGGNNVFWVSGTVFPHLFSTGDAVYDVRWVTAFVREGDVVRAAFWGDPTPRVDFPQADFLAAWDASQALDPRLPWQRDQAYPSTEYTRGQVTWNLLHVCTWHTDEQTGLIYARMYGQPTDFDDDIQAMPILRFDLQEFTNVMNGG